MRKIMEQSEAVVARPGKNTKREIVPGEGNGSREIKTGRESSINATHFQKK